MQKYDFSSFKQTINLSQYAAAQGYELDKKKSTRSSLVMRHSNGDKIIVSKKGANWVYFSVHDDSDNGTIVDFVETRTSKTLPDIGKELAAWNGEGGTLPIYSHLPDVQEQAYDPGRIKKAFRWMKPVENHPYLIEGRKIPADVLNHPRFMGRIFQDRYGNVVFPHEGGQGVCGLELKNYDKGIFMRGSEKALWLGNIDPADTVLTLAESSIDALSHFALFKPLNTSYGAVSGGMGDRAFEYLMAIIQKMPRLEKIILAVDHDKGGEKIASRIEIYLEGKFTGEIVRDIPQAEGMDWNEFLKILPY